MSPPPVIIGLGEVLWDIYPDAPRLGGAPANFACHAASLGAEAWMAGAVGTDPLGVRAAAELERHGVHCGLLQRDPSHATGQVFVKVDKNGRASYEFAADGAWDHLAWGKPLEPLAARCDAVCFGTLGQRSATSRQTIHHFLHVVPRKALRVFDVNLRQDFYDQKTVLDSLALASAVKLNEEELPVVARLCGLNASGPQAMLRELMQRHALRLAVLTLGAQGAILMTEDGQDFCPASPTRPVDTVGAGDSFTATVVVDFLQGRPLAEINRHANAVAAFVCSQSGATPPLPNHLRFLPDIHII